MRLAIFAALAVLVSPALAEGPLADLGKSMDDAMKVRSEFFARYGVTEPDFEAKVIVAVKKNLRFAIIESQCAFHQIMSGPAYAKCLDQGEKAAHMLGEDMMAPDPEVQRLKGLFDMLLKAGNPKVAKCIEDAMLQEEGKP